MQRKKIRNKLRRRKMEAEALGLVDPILSLGVRALFATSTSTEPLSEPLTQIILTEA